MNIIYGLIVIAICIVAAIVSERFGWKSHANRMDKAIAEELKDIDNSRRYMPHSVHDMLNRLLGKNWEEK